MGIQKVALSWTMKCFFLYITWAISSTTQTNGERYHYPDKPYINISDETNQTCPNGCEICTNRRFICHQLNVSRIPQTWPVRLQYLELNNLPMKHSFPLQDAPFKRYSQLKYLDISWNTITIIANNSFQGLGQLEYLIKTNPQGYNHHLEKRNLGQLPPGAFSSLKNLKYLDLTMNSHMGLDNILRRLRDLPQEALLDYVDLSYTNDLQIGHTVMSYALRASKLLVFKRLQVKVLKLDGNHISAIQTGFGKYLQSLEYLSLRKNYLINFVGGVQWWNFMLMYKMKVLDIGRNAHLPSVITTTHQRQRNCIILPLNLEKLYIDNFQIQEEFKFYDNGICFNAHSSFMFLDMTGSTLASIGAPITGLESLRYLSLQSTQMIITNPETFNCRYWPNIRTILLGNLDLRPTFKTTDKDSLIFQNCSTIVSIDLENTKLSMLPKQTFNDMNQVQFINISGNGIKMLNTDLKNNMNLTLLNASSNLMTHLTSLMMSQLDMIAAQPKHKLVVDIQNNPLLCGCEQLKFIKWMKETKVEFHNFDEYTCISNDGSHSIKELEISKLELKCKLKMITIATAVSGTFLLTFLISIAIYIKRYRLEYLLLVSRQFAKRVIQTKKQTDDYKKFQYHGFLSYSSLDDISVIVQIQKKMEEEFGLQLVIHDRDFVPGKYIIENITNFVEVSRKVVILMSNNYLESKWCNFEFDLSRNKRLDATYDAMVMIMLHDVEDLNKTKMSSSLKSYIGQKTYLEWPKNSSQKPTFWLRLKEALDFGDIKPIQNSDDDLIDTIEDAGTTGRCKNVNADDELINLNESHEITGRIQIEAEVHVHEDTQPLITI